MKKIFIFALSSFASLSVMSQSVNYALTTKGDGHVKTTAIDELNGASQATLQLWVKPTQWNNGALLLSQDNLSLECGANQSLVIRSGSQATTINCQIPANTWSQLTIVLHNGAVTAFVNGVSQEVTGSLPVMLADVTSSHFTIAENFHGSVDEIRVWNKAIEEKDFFWYNTLNKFNPNYENLISYWKCDQDLCENLVDYKFAHHGKRTLIEREPVVDNDKFQYRIVSGYIPSFQRFMDRKNIDREMFLMTNDAILLSGKIQDDGSIFPEYPDNSLTPTQVSHLKEFEGRTGVMSFNGQGSGMLAQDGRAPFSPVEGLGYGATSVASFASWVYIDEWKEGATLFSKYEDAQNCMTVKLGNEQNKEIVVDLCGTIATLSNKVTVGKWHYIGVYFKPSVGKISNLLFNPLNIGVDYTVYNKITERKNFKLSGADMTIKKVPLLEHTPIEIGNGFSGKLDEVMLWGSDRSSAAQSDAENGYQWNVGKWDNIFLNAYWKGDDAQNIGKDYQSYTHMVEIMRGYYKGHRGMKIRLGLIYPKGDGWKNVLDKKENVDRLIADSRKYIQDYDGLDVDLEWHNYHVFNPVCRRLIDEVMFDQPEEKIFSVSQHEYSYTLDKSLIPDVDYFTMQLYGPQQFSYQYDWYVAAHKKFIDYGYPKEKLLLSYGVLLVNQGEEGYKDLYEKYGYNDSNFDPDLNEWNCNGTMKYFNGINQTKRKQDFVIDNNCLGTMYFDMANDQPVSDYKSLIRAQNDVIASNVDTIVTEAPVDPSSILPVSKKDDVFTFMPNPAKEKLYINLKEYNASLDAYCEITTLSGTAVFRQSLDQPTTTIDLPSLNKGVYMLKVAVGTKFYTKKLQIN